MRSFVLVVLTLFVAAFGFGVYWVLQGSEGIGPDPTKRLVSPVAGGATTLPTATGSGLHPGTKPYWERRDPATGEITSRMRAASYEFLKDGRAKVEKPEVEFFLHDGQLLRIIGETGTVIMEETGKVNSSINAPAGVPRGGELQKVRILMLPSAAATRPTLTVVTNNVSFDNETFQVQTAAFEADGQTVPWQLVPVTVRGDDYEFDGRGLRMRYDELRRRLDFLQISSGQRLLVKHPKKIMKGAETSQQPVAAKAAAPGPVAQPAAVAPMPLPAQAKPTPVATPATPVAANAAEAKAEEPVYRATFDQSVQIFQGGQRIATAQTLQVDFLGRGGDDLSSLGLGSTTTRPANGRAETKPIADVVPKPEGVAEAASTASAAAGHAMAKASAATQPEEQPLEIRWTGPLTVLPVPGDRPDRIASGESIIRMASTPIRPVLIVRETPEGKHVLRCGSLTYWTIDGGVQLENAENVPVEMTDSRGSHLVTQSLLFSQKDGTALLTGKSRATIPLQMIEQPKAANDAKPDLLNVSWTDRCTLYLEGSVLEEMTLMSANLQGSVIATHPRVQLSSQTLQLAFAPPEPGAKPAAATQRSSPVLKQMDASGNVRCVARGTGGEADVRRIDCDTLTLQTARTPTGELYAQTLVAIGQVHAVDQDRDLKAGFVAVSLAPPSAKSETRPAIAGADVLPGQLESLIAHENVRVTTANGEVAEGDELVIKTEGKETEATLHGRPATVTRGNNVLSGPILDMLQERQQLTVTGEGKLKGMTEKKGNRPPRPVVVTWQKSMRADAKENLIECFGGVTATTLSDENGSETIVRGERVKILTTQPVAGASDAATQRRSDEGKEKGATTRPTTRPGEFDNLGDRQVRSIWLDDSAQVDSHIYGPGRELLRLFHVESSSIQYEREIRKLTIPQAGQMLFMDNRPAAATPSAVEAAKDPMGIRGNTAFRWKKNLVYDELARVVTLNGDVRISRENAGADDKMTLDADTVVAEIEPPAADATQPAAKPAGQADLDEELANKVQFKRVRAEGNVTVKSKQFSAEATSIDYDPAKHELTVRGTRNQPATWTDASGSANVDELIWNTLEGRIVNAKEFRAVGGKLLRGPEATNPAGGSK
jgi:hypothetical protein